MRDKLILISILFLGSFLRFFWLDKIPPSLSWDEVAIGYNAWSILATGKDEYGQSLPLLFRSFDDYKLPGMVYITALSEKIFGLNEWGVRFPSAFLGILTVLVFYFLLRELFPSFPSIYHFLPTFLLAINPWHINFSRQCFETNGSLFFVVLGIFFLLKALRRGCLLFLSSISFVLSVYFYYSARIVVPFLLLAFLAIWPNFIRKNLKVVSGAFFLGILVFCPLLPHILSPAGFSRIDQVSVFNDPNFIRTKANFAKMILAYNNVWWARIFYNRRIALFWAVFANYLKNFSPEFIFARGTDSFGLLYPWELPFFFLGIFALLLQKERWRWFFLSWLVVAPLPAGLTRNQPNPLRSLLAVPIFVFVSAFGLLWFWRRLSGCSKKAFLCVLISLAILFFWQFLILYFDYSPKTRSLHFGDGYRQLSLFLKEKKAKYDRIWITGEYWRPYIHLLFHLQYPPSLYQEEGGKEGFSLFRFGKADWDREGVDLGETNLSQLIQGKTLFILSPEEYQKQKERNKFSWEKVIDGRYAPGVFWAVEL